MRVNVPTPQASIKNLGDLVSAGVTTVIVIAGLLTFLYLVWGGIEWLTSGGDKDKYEAARNRITAALIGLAIISASWAIMQLISHFFGISITTLNIPSAVKQGGSSGSRFQGGQDLQNIRNQGAQGLNLVIQLPGVGSCTITNGTGRCPGLPNVQNYDVGGGHRCTVTNNADVSCQ